MKVAQADSTAHPEKASPKVAFQLVLQRKGTVPAPGQRAKPSGKGALSVATQATSPLTRATAAATQAMTLTDARRRMNGEAARLHEVRREGEEQHGEARSERALDILGRDLRRESAPVATDLAPLLQVNLAAPKPAGQPGVQSAPVHPGSLARQLQDVVEKIEWLVKSHRPALSLTLKGELAGELQVDRVGPREVALRIKGKNGPPTSEAVGRIREEIQKKGLILRALHVA